MRLNHSEFCKIAQEWHKLEALYYVKALKLQKALQSCMTIMIVLLCLITQPGKINPLAESLHGVSSEIFFVSD